MTGQTRTYTEVVQACYGLPHPHDDQLSRITDPFYRFRLNRSWDDNQEEKFVTAGWVLPPTVAKMPWTSKFKVDHRSRTVDIPYGPGPDYETRAIAEQLELACRKGCIAMSSKFQAEKFKILDIDREIRISRGGSALFGVQTMGIQMTAYTRDLKSGEVKIWVPKRSSWRHAHPGKLDNTVGGGSIADEKTHFETMVREAQEEASFPEEYMRKNAKPTGRAIHYWFIRDSDETPTLDRSRQFTYDVELPSDIVPVPSDGEVEFFHLWTVSQCMDALRGLHFKPNAAVTLIDFLIRKGYICVKDEPELESLMALIHRRPVFHES